MPVAFHHHDSSLWCCIASRLLPEHTPRCSCALQEYTLIKMRVLELKGKLAGLADQGPVFLMAATLRYGMEDEAAGKRASRLARLPCGAELPAKGSAINHSTPTLPCRPETMYGQTNCWALPDGDYAAFRGLNGEVYIMTDRSALNLSYQVGVCG